MNTETHKKELQELFPNAFTNYNSGEIPNTAKVVITKKLTRLEIGHLFSLGMICMKRSGTGISITFDLNKASLNAIYQPN